MERCVMLEPKAVEVCKNSATVPLIYQLPPAEGRKILEQAQNMPVCQCPAEICKTNAVIGKWGCIPVYFVVPKSTKGTKSVIFYIHGAGWVFGSFHTHEKLVRELAYRTNSVVIFPEYSRSPEVRYPVAMEQCYGVLCQSGELMEKMGLQADLSTLTVAGDSVGGNLVIAMTLLSKYRRGPRIDKQLLYYPVTNACFDTESYCQFECGYYLYRDGMKWFWDQYTPCLREREQITASPLRAGIDELRCLPEAMILNGEADVLRDEGEAYGRKLRKAGVSVTAVRFGGMIHDFVMLHSLDQTNACRSAMDSSTDWINRINCRKK